MSASCHDESFPGSTEHHARQHHPLVIVVVSAIIDRSRSRLRRQGGSATCLAIWGNVAEHTAGPQTKIDSYLMNGRT